MINPTLQANRVFVEQVETFLKAKFHQNTMEGTKSGTRKKYTCVISVIIWMILRQKVQ